MVQPQIKLSGAVVVSGNCKIKTPNFEKKIVIFYWYEIYDLLYQNIHLMLKSMFFFLI